MQKTYQPWSRKDRAALKKKITELGIEDGVKAYSDSTKRTLHSVKSAYYRFMVPKKKKTSAGVSFTPVKGGIENYIAAKLTADSTITFTNKGKKVIIEF